MTGHYYDEHPERGRHPLPLVEALEGARAQAVREERDTAVRWYLRWRKRQDRQEAA